MTNETKIVGIDKVLDALSTLGKSSRKTLPELIRVIKNNSAEKNVRIKAISICSELQAVEYVSEFLDILRDLSIDGDIRVAAVEAIGKMNACEIAPVLREILSTNCVENLRVHGTIIRVLGKMRATGAAQDLLMILKKYATVFRGVHNALFMMSAYELQYISEAFGDMQSEDAIPELIEMINDLSIDTLITEVAIRSIGQIGTAESVEYLCKLLHAAPPDSPNRLICIRVIGEVAISEAAPKLFNIATEARTSERERRAAVESLYLIANSETIGKLTNFLRDSAFGYEGRILIAESLGTIRKIDAINDLAAILGDPDESLDLRKTVATALSQIQTSAAIDSLLAALPDRSIPEEMKTSISRMFKRIKNDEMFTKLVVFMKIRQILPADFEIGEFSVVDGSPETLLRILAEVRSKSSCVWKQNILDFISEKLIEQNIKTLVEKLKNSRNGEKRRIGKLLLNIGKQRKIPILLEDAAVFSWKRYFAGIFGRRVI